MTVRLAVLLSAAFVIGCGVKTDLGKTCSLFKRGPDGGAVPIKEQDIAGKANKDFISFGAVECEDLVCVRDSSFVSTAQPTDNAQGYCSRPCVLGSTTGCPAADSADDQNPTRRLSCRALLLDETTLAACRADPDCKARLGDTTAPYFCARGKPDGGS